MPNFLIVGAQKAGTRWLRHNLGCHPDVFTAEAEVGYFHSRRFRLGRDWYRRQFAGWSGQRAVGESTPAYSAAPDLALRSARRIEVQLPEARLFAVLRDPCERTYSAFIHHMGLGRIDPSTDLLEYVEARPPEEDGLRLVVGGLYAENLSPYLERFGDRLLVLLNEEIDADPDDVYRRALSHLDLDTGFRPEELDRVRFSNPTPRGSKYRSSGRERRALSERERRALYPYFAADVERLETILGRDLSHWRPSGASSL